MKINDAGTAAELTAQNPAVPVGVLMMERDTGRAKWGTNGTTTWNDLEYWTPAIAGEVGSVQIVHKTADQSNSTLVLDDIADLSWTIVSDGIYIVEAVVMHHTAATTTGLVVSMNGPASPTYLAYGTRIATGLNSIGNRVATVYDDRLESSGAPAGTGPSLAYMYGYVVNGVNAGTLALRMTSEVDTSAVTVMRGSWGRLTRVA